MDILRGCLEVLISEIPFDEATINISKEVFCTYATRVFPQYNGDEIEYIYQYQFEKKNSTVFDLIQRCSNRFLLEQDGRLLCRRGEGLRWRQLYNKLGQDIFTTMFYAERHDKNLSFDWMPIIDISDEAIDSLRYKDVAENHFHLWGSTQIFPLSFSCLMNNIGYRQKQFKNIGRYLSSTVRYNTNGSNDKSLYSKCAIAAAIRLYLFAKLNGGVNLLSGYRINTLDLYSLDASDFSELNYAITAFKHQYGKKDQLGLCLDYAHTTKMQSNDLESLMGERNFLYMCFRGILNNSFNDLDNKYFYSYLIIKNSFRNELIQTNQRVGFKNFSNYQDRKEIFIDGYKQYERAAVRLAVNANMEDGFITNLEARISPKETSYINKKEIMRIDNLVDLRKRNFSKENYYYVLHFPKKAEKIEVGNKRHYIMRKQIYKKARAIYSMLILNPSLRERIRGIDACSNEIGCRPEVYAPSFRYLINANKSFFNRLNATYHVGEDFLDIADGLRAIDEVLTFINFSRDNRLGHALALGLNVFDYYKRKRNQLIMTNHDAIDNIAWVVGKAEDFKISIDKILYDNLCKEYDKLVHKVYGSSIAIMDYYDAWKLRGDEPDLYTLSGWGSLSASENLPSFFSMKFFKNPSISDDIRVKAGALYYRYHFDDSVKQKGEDKYIFKTDEAYATLVSRIQEEMIKHIKRLGIRIEANPTSNVLISMIERYDKHPIFKFVEVGSRPENSICASVNTDDLGVFDTALQNEYSLVAIAMRKTGKYSEYEIKAYIEQLRLFGIAQIFK